MLSGICLSAHNAAGCDGFYFLQEERYVLRTNKMYHSGYTGMAQITVVPEDQINFEVMRNNA